MTKQMMDLRARVDKSADADLLGERIGFAAERLMHLEVGAKTGAKTGDAYSESGVERLARRNGDRDREWQTRAGRVEPRLPRPRAGSYVPSFPELRRAAQKAPTTAIQEACVHGVSTRSMDDLGQATGGAGISGSQISRPVSLRVYPERFVVAAEGQILCEHVRVIPRSYQLPPGTIYDWRHYLTVVQRKPGALRNGAPFAEFPAAFKQLQDLMLGKPGGDRDPRIDTAYRVPGHGW